MNIKELKENIEQNKSIPNILIFKCSSKSSGFIFHQYINRYAINTSLDIRFIETLSELQNSNLFDSISDDNNIYIYETTKLENLPTINNHNLWIKCSSISKKLVEVYEDIIIDIPKLEEWQIKDYINFSLPLVSDENKNKLYLNYKADLFRLELEIEKLKLFSEDKYNQIEDQLYVDSTEYNIFDITNAILKRDLNALNKLKYSLQYIDIDSFGLLKILLNNFRYVIDIQLAKNPTPEYVGVSNKQFWAIKNYSCGFYSKEELVYIYQFLLSLDNKIKNGYIPVNIAIDYIICKIILL